MKKKLTVRLAFSGKKPVFLMMFLLFSLHAFLINADNTHFGFVSQKIEELKNQNAFRKNYSAFNLAPVQDNEKISSTVKEYTLLNPNNDIAEIINTQPDYIRVTVPNAKGNSSLTVLLYKVDISPNGLTISTSDGRTLEVDRRIVNYRGCLENDKFSVASFTFSEIETMGMISNKNGNYTIGKIENSRDQYIIYNDINLRLPNSFECATNTSQVSNQKNTGTGNTTLSTKCVNWYWETDYDLFVNKGNEANVIAYLNGIFNNVSTLYANDGMSITLQTVFVWTATDPYTGPSTSDYLNQFGTNRTSFSGNLAHLIGLQGGGGVAWLNGFCASTSHKMAYSGISSSYNTVPTYSWTVEVMAHEEGHLFGSHHTHDCVWNGNNTKIDACGDVAGYPSGSCAQTVPATPAGGGTIMSYCHLTSAGINFSLGFGPQPANLMLVNENNSSCLTACTGCVAPAQPGTIAGNAAVCASSSQTYSVAAVSGATSYTWSKPSGWSGSSTSNSITLTAGTSGGTLSVIAVNSCGSSSARTLTLSITALPAQPGTISGSASVCASSSQTYSVSAVSGATSYTWTLPNGWSGSSATNSINTTVGSSGGSITVKANNGCGSSSLRTLTTSIITAPGQPGAIAGSTSVCQNAAITYSISSVAGATGYIWTLPSGWNGSSIINSINSVAGSAGGTISVLATNACGNSVARTINVNVNPLPSSPASIIATGGNTRVCPGDAKSYHVNAVSGATSYTWTPPAGATITSGQGTVAINVSFTTGFTISDSLKVKANNGCGSSASRAIKITRNLPTSPSIISGQSAGLCGLTNVPYTVTNVAGMTYNWVLTPAGVTIASGQGTNSVIVNYGSGNASGLLKVTANNACGTSNPRNLNIQTSPATPGAVTGAASVCANQQGVPYSISPVSTATSYTWTGPTGCTISDGSVTSPSISLTTSSTSVTVNYKTTGGLLKVKATNSCGTGSISSVNVAISCRETGKEEDNNESDNFLVYPNPAKDQLTVSLNLREKTNLKIMLYDLSGRMLILDSKDGVTGLNSLSMDIHTISKGIYMLQVMVNGNSYKSKVFVE